MSKVKSKKTAEDGFDLAGQIKASKVVLHRTDQLIPYARNARKHEPWQVAQIAASIKEFGFTNPVLIDETGEIVAGHGRVMAALKLDLPEVPCIVLGHLTPTQRKAYVLADNQLALNSSWDWEMLNLEISELKEVAFDLESIGLASLVIDESQWDVDGTDLSDVAANLDGIISTIKVKCPQEQKEELLMFLKGKILESSFEGIEIV